MTSPRTSQAADRVIVALDVPSAGEALNLVRRLDGQCRWFKVGLELFLSEGPTVVHMIRNQGFQVFLDLKLHDIPNTVASAVQSVARLDVALLTVHAAGGPAMLHAALNAAAEHPSMQLLAVTVLTSMDQAQLHACGIDRSAADQVSTLGALARACRLPGLVCSAEEIGRLRSELGDDPLLVVPGIRPAQPAGSAHGDDQRRIATPAEAIHRGASMLVIGRPITRAPDPASAAAAILEEIQIELDRNVKKSGE